MRQVRAFALRHTRYLGLATMRRRHFLTAAALNLVRLAARCTEQPRAATRHHTRAALPYPPLATAAPA